MQRGAQPRYTVHRHGGEQEPVVVIDHFSGMVGQLIEEARRADFTDAQAYYPGLRARADAAYLDRRRDLLLQVLKDVFGIRQG